MIPTKEEIINLLTQVAAGGSDKSPRQRVVDGIATLIEDKRLPAETPLPSTIELGDIFGVSIVTLQAAMDELAKNRGLINRKSRVGSFVASLPVDSEEASIWKKVCVFANLEMDNAFDKFGRNCINAILQAGHRRGYEIVLEHESRFDALNSEENIIRWKRMAAVVFISPSVQVLEQAKNLAKQGCRILLLNAHCDEFGVGCIYSDNETGCYQAMKKLISLGHRKICFLVAGPLGMHSSYLDRLAGCKRACDEAGVEYPIVQEGLEMDALKHLLEDDNENRVTAIMDIGCPGLFQAIELMGLSVPDDVSIVSYDQAKTILKDGKTVATVIQPTEESVERAFSLISNLESGGFTLKLPQKFYDGRTIGAVKNKVRIGSKS